MANNRKNTSGAKLKLSDEQVQQVIQFLMIDANKIDGIIKISNKEKIEMAARLFSVHPQMIIDLTKGKGRFKNLLHTENHKALVEAFKKVEKSTEKKEGYKKQGGHSTKKIKFTPEQIKDMVELLNGGFHINEVASVFNCSTSTIFRNVEKHPDYIAKSTGYRKRKSQEVPEAEVVSTQSEVIEHSIDNLINSGIQQSLKKILVNPEFYYDSINRVNSQFFSIATASQQEIDNIIIFRSFTILQGILNISAAELQAVYLTLTLSEGN